jgi:hypothetical protein
VLELRGSNQPQSQPQHRQVGPTHFEGAEEEPARPRGRPTTRRRRSTRCQRDGPRGAPPHRPGPADDGRRGPRPSSASTSPGGAASRACGGLRAREDPEDGQAPRPDGHRSRRPPPSRAPALHSAGGRQRPGSALLSRALGTPGRARRQRACSAMSARARPGRSSTDRRPRGPSTAGQHSRAQTYRIRYVAVPAVCAIVLHAAASALRAELPSSKHIRGDRRVHLRSHHPIGPAGRSRERLPGRVPQWSARHPRSGGFRDDCSGAAQSSDQLPSHSLEGT